MRLHVPITKHVNDLMVLSIPLRDLLCHLLNPSIKAMSKALCVLVDVPGNIRYFHGQVPRGRRGRGFEARSLENLYSLPCNVVDPFSVKLGRGMDMYRRRLQYSSDDVLDLSSGLLVVLIFVPIDFSLIQMFDCHENIDMCIAPIVNGVVTDLLADLVDDARLEHAIDNDGRIIVIFELFVLAFDPLLMIAKQIWTDLVTQLTFCGIRRMLLISTYLCKLLVWICLW